MIEAVNSVLSNTQALKSSSDQVDVARTPTPVQASEGVSVPLAPFISPYISLDVNNNAAVLQIRDSDTGDVVNQFPSEARLEQIRREEVARQRQAVNPERPSQLSQNTQTTQSSQAQISIQEQSSSGSRVGVSNIGSSGSQAQIASAALASAAQAASSSSAGVSVSA